jgi:GLE1-like protein/CCCH-type zinc finger/Zinc finger C-x8-C-x5-C-x3-H type (and similar)
MLSLIAAKVKDVVPVLSAHIYTVCPTAIPILPASAEDDNNEDAFMEQLGMMRGKDGRFESFERFLSRTEGLISLVANIMASEPSDHPLMGGHLGAIKWLQRFLALLPEAPQSPLPLITAPVLDAFLTGAGHMMANIHTETFRELLDVITNDVCLRLDESAIGMPSATRLRKTIRVGLKGFQETLPSRALPELYYGADKSKTSDHTAFALLPPPESNATPVGEPMGSNNNRTDRRAPCKFFAEGRCRNGENCNFSHDLSNDRSSFGGAFGSSAAAPLGSGGAAAPSPFGSTAPAASSPFGTTAPAAFGSGAPAPAPFGSGAPASSPFGSSFGTTAAAPAPFGSGAPAPTPFGSGAPAASPFGSPFGITAPAPAAFGSGAPALTAFGSGAPAASPFGPSIGTTPTAPAPFGSGAPAPTPFGSGAPTASPFGSPFGTAAPSSATFGSGAAGPSPFGSGAGQSTQDSSSFSFGGNTDQKSSPFASSANNSVFGATSTTFGGGSTAPQQTSPFAAPATGLSSIFGTQPPSSAFGSTSSTSGMATNYSSSSSTPFGAPQQSMVSSNPSPFGSARSPFGSTAAPFGTSPAPSVFGGSTTATNPSQFASTPSTNSPFGGGAKQVPNSSFGNSFSQQEGSQSAFGQSSQHFGLGQGGSSIGDNRPPCKFYSKGQCKYGTNCNFSHGNPSTTFGSTMTSPFGAPRR